MENDTGQTGSARAAGLHSTYIGSEASRHSDCAADGAMKWHEMSSICMVCASVESHLESPLLVTEEDTDPDPDASEPLPLKLNCCSTEDAPDFCISRNT